MLEKFIKFWVKNWKITLMFIIIVFLWGILSWIMIPKQYNPDIVVPAFEIIVPAPGYSSQEVQQLVVKPFENKLNEIEGVEHIYSVANRDYAAIMVMYYVGTDKEKATTRLYNKINSSIDIKPLWVQEPSIKSIDPDDIPIYTFAISSDKKDDDLTLRKIWTDVIDKLKLAKNSSSFYLVWWQKENINIKVDLQKLEAKNVDIMQVYQTLQKNNISFPWWDTIVDNRNSEISVDWNLNDIDKVKKLIISYVNNVPIYIDDVATVYKWISEQKYFDMIWDKNSYDNAIFVWIAKKKWTNAVFVVEEIKKELDSIKQQLPKWYKITEIQNEWKTAEEATNTLLEELVKAIAVLFIILLIFLGLKDSISSSLSIPLILSIVFGVWLVIWDNINRITLFALILVLWMLVDDSIIVVENISRHMELNKGKWISKLKTILEATTEIASAAFFSTITKIMAFVGMFFVWGMMGQYMWPIPKYAIIALSTSLLIAFSVNPFFSFVFAKKDKKEKQKIKNLSQDDENTENNENKGNPDEEYEYVEHHKTILEKGYLKIMNFLLDEKKTKTRKFIKILFWMILAILLILPPSLGIFKMRMLPKSNKEQVYLWIDAPRSYTVSATKSLADDLNNFMKNYYISGDEEKIEGLSIIQSVSYWIGNAPVPDFANLFRGSNQREAENYISMRINLSTIDERKLNSEQFVIQFRPVLKEFLKQKYPDVKMRLLEDPPWPPVKATFMIEVRSNDEKYENLETMAELIKNKIKPQLTAQQVEDIYTTRENYKTNYVVKLDHEVMSRSLLDSSQVSMSIYSLFHWNAVNTYHTEDTKEPINIYLSSIEDQKNDIEKLKSLTFTNSLGKKIPLTEIAQIQPTSMDRVIYSDDRQQIVYIYGEMGNNSVIYPVIDLFKTFLNPSFWGEKYQIVSWDPYWIQLKQKDTWTVFDIKFGGEWKLTVDTFKDLGSALILTLFGLYFLVSARFSSFSLWGIIMLSFLLWLFGIMPGFSLLYLVKNEYFSATAMIWVIALSWIVIWNAIILLEYFMELKKWWMSLKDALLHAWYVRLRPILLTSITAILWAIMIVWDPVWSGLARAIVWGLAASAVLTLILIPVFVYDSLSK